MLSFFLAIDQDVEFLEIARQNHQLIIATQLLKGLREESVILSSIAPARGLLEVTLL